MNVENELGRPVGLGAEETAPARQQPICTGCAGSVLLGRVFGDGVGGIDADADALFVGLVSEELLAVVVYGWDWDLGQGRGLASEAGLEIIAVVTG